MAMKRSILLYGFWISLKRGRAVLWTYALNLGIALLFSLRLHSQLSAMLDHSFASQGLVNGFDLGTLLEVNRHLALAPGGGIFRLFMGAVPVMNQSAGVPILFGLTYFLLVPGTLSVYQSGERARFSTLLHQGILYFWRFLRITIISAIAFAIVLGPLGFVCGKILDRLDEHVLGRNYFLCFLTCALLLLLIAAVLRLYFDLVETYTIQLGLRDDRRVRRALGPALHALRKNFFRAYGSFLLLAVLGYAALAVAMWIGVKGLAQPAVLPSFLVEQLGIFALFAARFWQRGAETALTLDYPIPIRNIHHEHAPIADAVPNPEPEVPSLPGPDLAVYRPEDS